MEPGDPLRICTRFLLPLDAEIFAARLQAEGIDARVMDADTLYVNGAVGSLGMGGVRVMVPESQLADAQRVLGAFNAGEYAIDESFDPGEE
jgi:Putative prokaryotic signal transducing protein